MHPKSIESSITSNKNRTYRKQKLLIGQIVNLQKPILEHIQPLYRELVSPGVLDKLTLEIDSLDDFRRYIIFILNQWTMNQDFTYSILNNKKQLIGQISLYDPNFTHRRGEVGIWLGHQHWHKGYGYDAIYTLCTHAFEDLHFNRLQAHIFLENNSSISLFEKIGFQKEGISREYVIKDGEYKDVFIYSLLASEFSNNKINKRQ